LELSFVTKQIRDICERDRRAIDEFGPDRAQLLHDAIAELRAAPAVADIADWIGRMLPRRQSDRLVLHFGGFVEIEFTANHIRNPMDVGGDLAWEQVNSIKILKMEIKNAKDN